MRLTTGLKVSLAVVPISCFSSSAEPMPGDLVVMLVLGGIGTVFGPMLGALAFLGLEEILKMFTDHWLAVFGLVIVFIGLLGKAGIAGFLDSFSRRAARRKAKAANQGAQA